MDTRNQLPGMLTRSVMIWRAERIADPLEKLRFLRTATRTLRQSRRWGRRASAFGLAGMVLVIVQFSVPTATSFWTRPLPPAVQGSTASAGKPPKVWLVERNAETEVYSNGLRVESKGSGTLHPRRYQPLDRARPETWRAEHNSVTTLRTEPAGIVFHTTESDLVPFDSTQNHQLQRLGQGILSFIRRNKSYHYLVDRFGRVHRVVDEASSANHAGWSVWADRRSIYLNLNHSFLAIAFEAQTRPQDGVETINEAQLHAGRVLTDMLRDKYGIAAENCVTHAQVSVNPVNYRIGAHTDWAVRFPYAEMGLPDNYAAPVPSMTVFGFIYDSSFVSISEARLWKGLLLAQEEVRQAANAKGMKVPVYRAALNRKYKELTEALKAQRKLESL